MPESWFVTPATTRLDLSGGQWIEVKQRLTYGEQTAMFAALIKDLPQGAERMTLNPEMTGLARVLAYLVDWSLRSASGEPVRIDTQAKKTAALKALDPDKFALIHAAISTHIEGMEAETVAEKNGQRTSNDSGAISSSAV